MLSLVHLIYMAGDKCMRQNACLCLKYNIGDKYLSFDRFYLRISAVLKWKTLLPHINFQRLL